MEFVTHSFKFGYEIITSQKEYKPLWDELVDVLNCIVDEDIIDYFQTQRRQAKSISDAINHLIKNRLVEKGWSAESAIFKDDDYRQMSSYRLDFAKDFVSMEVGFNHREAIAWNLLKPVIASELNHVQKALQTKIGIVVTATEAMKKSGGFDSAVGTYENLILQLKPMSNFLSVPIIVIGLLPPKTFHIKHNKIAGKTIGEVVLECAE